MKRWLIRALVEGMYWVGLWPAILLCERLVGRRRHIVVLVYHHLRSDSEAQTALSSLAAGLPVAQFERQIQLLRRWYTPINVHDFEEILDGRSELSADSMLVTLDDGYLDTRTVAGPCLRRYRIPALVFIATGMVDSPRSFWWVRVDDVLGRISAPGWQQATNCLARHTGLHDVMTTMSIDGWKSRRWARQQVVSVLRVLEPAQREEILDCLEAFTPPGPTSLPLLGWRDIREMAADGFTFGAHTHTHPRLTRLSIPEVRREIAESVEVLYREAGVRAGSFAYPAGDYNEAVAKEVLQTSVRLAFTTKPGVVIPGQTPRNELPRLSLWRSGRGELALCVVAVKLMKYFPRLMSPMFARLFA